MASELAFLRRSPSKQLTVFVLIAVVATLIMAAAYFAFLRKSFAPLYTQLRPADAAAAVAELDKAKIPYQLTDGGATILVDKKSVDSARLKLASTDLAQRGLVGFEMFSKSDMGLTEFAQRINYQRALQGELTRTILGFDGVETARVHLSLPEQAAFRVDKVSPKASVEVTLKPGATLTPETVAGIQHLVSTSVPDMNPQAVVVLDGRGAVVSNMPGMETLSPDDQQVAAIESYYIARVRRALGSVIPGTPFNVTAKAGVPDGQLQAILQSWSPQTRTFPVTLELQLPFAPDPNLASRLQAAAVLALGAQMNGDSARVQTVSLRPAPSTNAGPLEVSAESVVAPPPVESAAAPPPPVELKDRFWRADASALFTRAAQYTPLLLALVGGLIATLASVLLAIRFMRPRRLNKAQQDQMALQFKSLMPEEESHAA